MAKTPHWAACGFAGALMLAAFTDAPAFDAEALTRQGDVYVVALREGYLAHAELAQKSGDAASATFWRGRARSLERQVAGDNFQIAPLAPARLAADSPYQRGVLANAYQETAAVVDSEAADAEPVRVAAVQIDFEGWLYDAHRGIDDRRFAKEWSTWDRALGALVDGTPPPDRPVFGTGEANGS